MFLRTYLLEYRARGRDEAARTICRGCVRFLELYGIRQFCQRGVRYTIVGIQHIWQNDGVGQAKARPPKNTVFCMLARACRLSLCAQAHGRFTKISCVASSASALVVAAGRWSARDMPRLFADMFILIFNKKSEFPQAFSSLALPAELSVARRQTCFGGLAGRESLSQSFPIFLFAINITDKASAPPKDAWEP